MLSRGWHERIACNNVDPERPVPTMQNTAFRSSVADASDGGGEVADELSITESRGRDGASLIVEDPIEKIDDIADLEVIPDVLVQQQFMER